MEGWFSIYAPGAGRHCRFRYCQSVFWSRCLSPPSREPVCAAMADEPNTVHLTIEQRINVGAVIRTAESAGEVILSIYNSRAEDLGHTSQIRQLPTHSLGPPRSKARTDSPTKGLSRRLIPCRFLTIFVDLHFLVEWRWCHTRASSAFPCFFGGTLQGRQRRDLRGSAPHRSPRADRVGRETARVALRIAKLQILPVR